MRLAKTLLTMAAIVLPVVAAEVPRKAPEFAAQLPGGKQLLLSQYKGKVVALAFVFTTCPHCQRACQLMNALQNEYGAKGFQPIAVAFNDMSAMLVPDFTRDFGIKFPVGSSNREQVLNYLQQPVDALVHVPQIVIIDRNGMIRQQSLPQRDETTATERNLRGMIEKLLAEPTGTQSGKPATKSTKKAS